MTAPRTLFNITPTPPIAGMVFALDRFAEDVSDFSELFEGFGEIFRDLMTEQFSSEGKFAGGWASLSPRYAAWKEEHYPGRPIGVLRGYLRDAMTGKTGYSELVGKTQASWGMSVTSQASEYGEYFSERRPVIKWTRAESRRFQRYAHVWAYNALHGPGGSSASPSSVPGVLGGL